MNIKKFNKIFLYFSAMLMLAITGCKKDDGPIKEEYLNRIEDVPAISTRVDATGSQAIDMLNLGAFQGKFNVSKYFENAVNPEKVDVVVRKNSQNGGNVKVYKAGVTSYPSDYTVSVAELESLFGAPVALGDTYDFSVDIYANGKKYEAFPAVGLGSGSGPNGMPNYSYFARFGAICAYDPEIYVGDFEVVSDEWGDYAPGDVVTIEKVADNKFSFKYPDSGSLPIVVTVNTGNNATSVTKQVYAPNGYGTAYGAFSVESVASPSDNLVAPCSKTFSVRLQHTVSAGSFGAFTIKMKKKE